MDKLDMCEARKLWVTVVNRLMPYLLVALISQPVALSYGQAPAAPMATQSAPAQPAVTAPPQLPANQTPAQPTTSSTIRIEPIGSFKLESGVSAPWWSYFVPLGTAVLTLLGVWAGLWIGQRNTQKTIVAAQKNNDASVWQKANEAELKDIQSKLDGFYIPFRLLSDANHHFAQDLRAKENAKGRKDYRMLIQLFDQDWIKSLSDWDKKIVEIVCCSGEELRKLIETKSGLVDEQILPYLSRVSVHFRVLHLAYEGSLGSDPSSFKDYVYPRQLDDVLTLEVDRLRARMAQLRAKPGEDPGPIPPLNIPKELELNSWVDPDGRLQQSTMSPQVAGSS